MNIAVEAEPAEKNVAEKRISEKGKGNGVRFGRVTQFSKLRILKRSNPVPGWRTLP